MIWIVASIAALVLLLGGDWLVRRVLLARHETRARARAARFLTQAEEDAAARLREAELSARDQAARLEEEFAERELTLKRHVQEEDVRHKEHEAEREQEARRLQAEREAVARERAGLSRQISDLAASRAEAERREVEAARRLEEIAGLTREEARERLAREMTEKARAVAADETRRVFEEARLALDERLKDVATRSLQNLSIPSLIESTVSVVRLPSDEMKGRIIGREGRNIRSIEMIAGIDLIVDDTPGTILISCFDPLRREVARMAIERLVEDGRIHPARIEELVEKTRQDLEEMLGRFGESALQELGIHEVSPRLARLLGELRYHTSQGQNLLQHCRETADLAGLMALELGIDPEVPRRAGLLHEISQAVADRPTSPSILASSEMAGRHGESSEVQQAIAAAHPDVHPRHPEGALVRLACRLSRSRLGARKHNLDVFISRMRRMEGLAESFTGVRKAYALRAGRELRVLVESERLSDEQAVLLSRDIAGRIERELEHTGPIKVSVLRETRAMDYAL